MESIKSITGLVFIILVVIFAIQNIALVEIQVLLWNISIPRALLVVILMAIGFIIGLLFSSLAFKRRCKKPQ